MDREVHEVRSLRMRTGETGSLPSEIFLFVILKGKDTRNGMRIYNHSLSCNQYGFGRKQRDKDFLLFVGN